MALQKKDREFRLTKISYLDFKYIEMDRVLTGLFERLEHIGYPSVFRDKRELTVEKFVDDIISNCCFRSIWPCTISGCSNYFRPGSACREPMLFVLRQVAP